MYNLRHFERFPDASGCRANAIIQAPLQPETVPAMCLKKSEAVAILKSSLQSLIQEISFMRNIRPRLSVGLSGRLEHIASSVTVLYGCPFV